MVEGAKSVLIAGAGGGFDIYAGLPLFFWLRSMGITVHLSNLSFSDLSYVAGQNPVSALTIVHANSTAPSRYFPEGHLAAWLAQNGIHTPIHAISRVGGAEVAEAYEWIAQSLQPDTIILVDGGTDILMRGDEAGLGTPQEDIASLAAVVGLSGVERKLIACLGFGIDTHHGVCHANFLENVSALIEEGGFLGSWSLMREMHEFQMYEAACAFAHAQQPNSKSIVNSSIIASGNGWFGDRHPTARTEGSTLKKQLKP